MATAPTPTQGADPAGLTPRPVVIVGGGEHAGVVAEAVRSRPDRWVLVGFTDPRPGTHTPALASVEHLGADDDHAARQAVLGPAERPALVLGFRGSAATRGAATGVFGADATWATVVHARAWVAPSARLGDGTVVLAGAIVNAGAVIGAHCIVNTQAVVEHDVSLGAGSHVAPGAVIGGGTSIGRDATIGLGALVRDHLAIGDRSTVGMGAVVVEDVLADSTVVGNPARSVGVR
jgi:sugar O-acyltransferase (sialic acid O-acetyltransferase NeuD family)